MSQQSKDLKIKLHTIDEIKILHNSLSQIDFEVYFVSGKYFLDAKSLMSIFTLDLTKDLILKIYFRPEQKAEVSKFVKDIDIFRV